MSSNTNNTVALDVAQSMDPRPPPSLMMSNKNSCASRNQRYRERAMKDVLSSTLEGEYDKIPLEIYYEQEEEPSFQPLIKSNRSSRRSIHGQSSHNHEHVLGYRI
jgi:hypothetical protein